MFQCLPSMEYTCALHVQALEDVVMARERNLFGADPGIIDSKYVILNQYQLQGENGLSNIYLASKLKA